MANTHKAWRLHAHNDLRFDDVETPRPAPDGVVVRIEAGMVLSYTNKVLPRVIPAVVSGDAARDLGTIRHAAAADVGLDLLGTATSTSTTLSSLRALKRGGRLVLMGSAEVPLELSFREMLANDWEVVGQFMYDRTAPGQLAALAADGLLDLRKIIVTAFRLTDFKQAVEAAALTRGLDLTAVVP
jgi:alcohol dehydrogenase